MSKTVSSSAVNQKVIVASAIISVIALFLFLRNYFMLIAVSAILAFLFNPVYKWFLKKFKNRQGASIAMTVVTLFATIAIPLTVLLAITIEEAAKLVDQVSQIVSTSGSAGEAINTLVAQFNEQADKRNPNIVMALLNHN